MKKKRKKKKKKLVPGRAKERINIVKRGKGGRESRGVGQEGEGKGKPGGHRGFLYICVQKKGNK